MVVDCISEEIQTDIVSWVSKRINDLGNLKKLHHSLLKEELEVKHCPTCDITYTEDRCPVCNGLGKQLYTNGKKVIRKRRMTKEGQKVFHDMLDDAIVNYSALGLEINSCPECGKKDYEVLFQTLKCIPREVKSDISPYLRNRSKYYEEKGHSNLSDEAKKLSSFFVEKVPNCTREGLSAPKPSPSWLRLRGFGKRDLVDKGNISQLP